MSKVRKVRKSAKAVRVQSQRLSRFGPARRLAKIAETLRLDSYGAASQLSRAGWSRLVPGPWVETKLDQSLYLPGFATSQNPPFNRLCHPVRNRLVQFFCCQATLHRPWARRSRLSITALVFAEDRRVIEEAVARVPRPRFGFLRRLRVTPHASRVTSVYSCGTQTLTAITASPQA